MALSAGTISMPVAPDAENFGSSLSQALLGQSGIFSGIGTKLGGMIIGGLAVAGIGAAVGSVFKTGFAEAKDASAGIAQLNAGLQSTGNAANVSVAEMTALASSIQNMSGQTDDSIVKAESLLLTFTNIKNVGTDKIFDQTTQAAADMAAKLGGDAASQALLLGKALNDPIRGLTALTRVGVSFTESQRESITAMVNAGDVMGAQKVILAELKTEFGGAAAAAGQSLPGQLARIKRSFEDISQSVAEAFLPIILPAIEGVSNALKSAAPSIAIFTTALSEKLTAGAAALKPVLENIKNGFGEFVTFVSTTLLPPLREAFKPVFDSIGEAFKALAPTFSSLIPQISELVTSFSPLGLIFKTLAPVIPEIVNIFGQLAATIAGALGQALGQLIPVISSLVQLMSEKLGETIKVLVPIISTIATILGTVLGEVIKQIVPIVGVLADIFGQVFAAILPLIPVILPLVGALLQLLAPIAQLVGALLTPLIKLLSAIIQPVIGIVTVLVNALMPAFKQQIEVFTVITNVIAVVIGWIANLVTWFIDLAIKNADVGAQINRVWTDISAGISNAVNIISGIVGFLGDVFNNLGQSAQPSIQLIGGMFEWLWSAIIQPISSFISSSISNIGATVSSVFGSIGGIITGAFSGVVDYVSGVFGTITDLINGVIDGINTVSSAARSIGINVGSIGRVPKLAEGGTVLPKPGGTLAILAEAGKPESVVDTGKLNQLLDSANSKSSSTVVNQYMTFGSGEDYRLVQRQMGREANRALSAI